MTSADRGLDGILVRSPLQRVARRKASSRLVVLAYHGVDDRDRFAAQLDWLVAESQPVTLAEAIDGIVGRAPLPPRAVLVTFDDGDRSIVEHGLAALTERGVPAVVFAVAGVVGTDEPFWFTEVDLLVQAGATAEGFGGTGRDVVTALKSVPDAQRRATIDVLRAQVTEPVRRKQLDADDLVALVAGGVEIGNHTSSHPVLARCDDAQLEAELVVAHERLTALLGRAPVAFAYPNGDHDDRVPPILRRLGYEVAFLFDHRLTDVPVRDPFRTSRVRVNSSTSLDRFRTIVSGLHPTIHRLRGRR